MTPELRMIETNGLRLRVALAGEGPLVVLVHGFPESCYTHLTLPTTYPLLSP